MARSPTTGFWTSRFQFEIVLASPVRPDCLAGMGAVERGVRKNGRRNGRCPVSIGLEAGHQRTVRAYVARQTTSTLPSIVAHFNPGLDAFAVSKILSLSKARTISQRHVARGRSANAYGIFFVFQVRIVATTWTITSVQPRDFMIIGGAAESEHIPPPDHPL